MFQRLLKNKGSKLFRHEHITLQAQISFRHEVALYYVKILVGILFQHLIAIHLIN